jgi:hypothetical protein
VPICREIKMSVLHNIETTDERERRVRINMSKIE